MLISPLTTLFEAAVDATYSFYNGVVWTKNLGASLYNIILSQVSSDYIPTQGILEATEKSRQAFWDKLAADTGIELVNHLRAFCEYDPQTDTFNMTRAAMFAGLKDLGFTAKDNALIVAASEMLPKLKNFHSSGFSFKHGHTTPFSPTDGPGLMHPHDTGFYSRDGSFNAERFAKLKKFAIAGMNGKLVISREKFDACRGYLDEQDLEIYLVRWARSELFDRWVTGPIGNMGEVGAMFDTLATELIDGVPHASLEDIEAFYRNTAKVMQDKMSVCDVETAESTNKELSTAEKLIQKVADSSIFKKAVDSAVQYSSAVVKDTERCYATDATINGQKQAFYNPTFFCPINNGSASHAISAPQPVPMLGR